MTTIYRKASVKYSAKQMYNLVNNIYKYPEFLPMCQAVEVHMHKSTAAKATLKIAKGGIKINFITYNEMLINKEIKIKLVKGPFKNLIGVWNFIPLSEESSEITLNLDFEFSSRFLEMALGVVFNTLANNMLDAFCNRAAIIYGEIR